MQRFDLYHGKNKVQIRDTCGLCDFYYLKNFYLIFTKLSTWKRINTSALKQNSQQNSPNLTIKSQKGPSTEQSMVSPSPEGEMEEAQKEDRKQKTLLPTKVRRKPKTMCSKPT